MDARAIDSPVAPPVADDPDLLPFVDGLSGPAYVYDLAVLRARVAEIREAFRPDFCRLFFATMANDNPTVLRELACLGVGACVNSLGHLNLALAAGMNPANIQFTATGLPRAVLEDVRDLGLAVNLDSPLQMTMAGNLGLREVGLRINASSLDASRPYDRMGTDIGVLEETLDHAAGCGLSVTGLHVYLGTNVQDPNLLLPALRTLFARAPCVANLRYLNVGGGIGLDYSHRLPAFDIARYGAVVSELSHELNAKLGRTIDIIIEPGRGLVASCGRFLTRVTDRKSLMGTNYLGVDASIAIFPRPFHHPDTPHRVRSLFSAGDEPKSDFVVVGCTTFSRDILGVAALRTSIEPGDLLVLDDAGAYCQSMTSRFLGQVEPSVHFLNL